MISHCDEDVDPYIPDDRQDELIEDERNRCRRAPSVQSRTGVRNGSTATNPNPDNSISIMPKTT